MYKDIKQEKHNYKKITLQVCILLITFIMIIGTLITVISTIKSSGNLSFGEYKFYIMKTEAKGNIAKKGDLIIVKRITKSDELKTGDDVVYANNGFYYCDRIIQTKKVNTITKLIIAEDNGIKYQFDEDEIEGKVISNIHNIGNIITFLKTVFGIIIFILFIICLFILLRMLLVHGKKCNEINNIEN